MDGIYKQWEVKGDLAGAGSDGFPLKGAKGFVPVVKSAGCRSSLGDGSTLEVNASNGQERVSGPRPEKPEETCTECEDVRATLRCVECEEEYCSLCWASLHRRGQRARHRTRSLLDPMLRDLARDSAPPPDVTEGTGWFSGVWPTPCPPSPAFEDEEEPDEREGGARYARDAGGVVAAAAGVPAEIGAGTASGGNGDIVKAEASAGSGGSMGLTDLSKRRACEQKAVDDDDAVGAKCRKVKGQHTGQAGHGGARVGEGRGHKASRVTNGSSGNKVVKATCDAQAREQQNGVTVAASGATYLTRGRRPPGHEGPLCPSGDFYSKAQAAPASPTIARKPSISRETPSAVCDSPPVAKRAKAALSGSCASGVSTDRPASVNGKHEEKGVDSSKEASVSAVRSSVSSIPSVPSSPSRPSPGMKVEIVDGKISDKSGMDDDHEGRSSGILTGVSNHQGVAKDAVNGDRAGVPEKGVSAACQGGASGGDACPMKDVDGKSPHANGHTSDSGVRVDGVSGPPANGTVSATRSALAAPLAYFNGYLSTKRSPSVADDTATRSQQHEERPDAASPSKKRSREEDAPGACKKESADSQSARSPTLEERTKLNDLGRRAANVPLRLNAHERSLLNVLLGTLRYAEYTNQTETLFSAPRIYVVLIALRDFFMSVWGLFTASAVAMPASAPPGMKRDVARQPSDAPSKMNGTSHHGVIGPIPLRAASTARVLNGVARPGLVGKAVGDGLKLATKVNGALAYREDSFDLGDSRYGMTREWAGLIRAVCEIGRRFKILNPEKMRGGYGMLMCILMDAQAPKVRAEIGFSCIRSMRTVSGLSASMSLQPMLADPDILVATRPVLPWTNAQAYVRTDGDAKRVEEEKKAKAKARERLLERYGDEGRRAQEISLIVDSLGDSMVYRETSTRPIRRMIALLKHNWRPHAMGDLKRKNISLHIKRGDHGARLSHEHATHFFFVLQSLTLWLQLAGIAQALRIFEKNQGVAYRKDSAASPQSRIAVRKIPALFVDTKVVDNMLDLWAAGERDLFDPENHSSLRHTTQGLQRIQTATNVGRKMREIQASVISETGQSWIGSAAIHLGDDCVPNALVFLDKYCQIPWILNPILAVIDMLTDLENGANPVVLDAVRRRWQSTDYAKRYILRNFFRFAFDGSGGNNDFEAGSCVDGRLTSAWNWCEKLKDKTFYPLFMLSGFSGFNGDFGE